MIIIRRIDSAGACGGCVTRYGVYRVLFANRYANYETLLDVETTQSDAEAWAREMAV